MTNILKPILRPIIQPLVQGPLSGGGIGAFLANLLTEEGERITTEENASVQKESSNA